MAFAVALAASIVAEGLLALTRVSPELPGGLFSGGTCTGLGLEGSGEAEAGTSNVALVPVTVR